MNNIKKIGLTALAGSLVATSVFAGELAVTGTASMTYENYTGNGALANAKYFTQANNVYFKGGGELDNGLTVAVSFELDDGANSDTASTSVWDNHSITVSSDTIGAFTLSGHGGSSAQSALDTTAAGDMWDNFDGVGEATAKVSTSKAANDIMSYKLPTVMDDLTMTVSYLAGSATASGEGSSMAYGATYDGVDGLSVSFGKGEDNSSNVNNIDATTFKASYAFSSFTVSLSDTSTDATTATTDKSVRSYAVSYTVSDNLSLTWGTETHDDEADTAADAEYTGVKGAYTTGGMTIKAGHQQGENTSYTTAVGEDMDYTYLTLAFAF